MSDKQHTLHLRFEEELESAKRRVTSTTVSLAIDIAALLQVRWQALRSSHSCACATCNAVLCTQ